MENEEQKKKKKTNINNSSHSMTNDNNSSHSMINNNTSSNNPSSPVHSINSSPVHSINSSPSRHSSNVFFSPQHLTSPVQQQHHEPQQQQQQSSSPTNSPDKTTATANTNTTKKKMSNINNISLSSLSPNLSPVFIPSKSVRDKPAVMTKVNDSNSEIDFNFSTVGNGEDRDRDQVVDGGGGRNVREAKTKGSVRVMGERLKRKAFLGFRMSGMILCLISFSIMATDKHQGWALDSFDRYKELRYCLAVNVIGFVYSAAQASVVVYDMATGNYKPHNIIRNHFDFFMDQVLSYLLISASSSAATRIEDWTSNWGEDKFTQTATISIVLSFLAFVALALSSLLSGFTLFTLESTS